VAEKKQIQSLLINEEWCSQGASQFGTLKLQSFCCMPFMRHITPPFNNESKWK